MGSSSSNLREAAHGSSGTHRIQYRNDNSAANGLSAPNSNKSSMLGAFANGSHTSLQKALSRRRSSNRTGGSQSSGSQNSHHYHSQPLNGHHSTGQHRNGSQSSLNDLSSINSRRTMSEEAEFRWIHGRRYHNTDSHYQLPCDSEEVDRLHLQHYIYRLVLGKNVHVPIPDCGRVLDLGCGPATWTMDMATDMTTVNFVGVDMVPIYPTAIHPRNCTFQKEDITKGLSLKSNTFDVVFQRLLAIGYVPQDWDAAIAEAFRVLKPGGWFETVETDGLISDGGPNTTFVFDQLHLSLKSRGVDMEIVKNLDRLLIKHGFVDVHVKEYMVPFGEWGGRAGKLWKQNAFTLLEPVKGQLAKSAKMSGEQVEDVVRNVYRETQSEYKSYQTIYVTCGRKP